MAPYVLQSEFLLARARSVRLPRLIRALAVVALSLYAGMAASATLVIDDKTLSVSQVCRIAFSPDGRLLAVAPNQTKELDLLDAATGVVLRRLKSPADTDSDGFPSALAFLPGTSSLIEADFNGRLRLWDIASGETIRTFQKTGASISAVVVQADGRRFVTAATDGGLTLWSVDSDQPVHGLKASDPSDSTSMLALSAANDRVAALDVTAQTLRVWDFGTGAVVRVRTGIEDADAVAFTADGTALIAKSGFDLRVWDARSGSLVSTLSLAAITPQTRVPAETLLRALKAGSAGGALDMVSPDATRVLVKEDVLKAGWDQAGLLLLDTATGAILHRFWHATINPNASYVISAAFAPDGRHLAVSSFDGAVRLWDTDSGALVYETGEVKDSVYSLEALRFSPDGRYFASGRTSLSNPDEPGFETLHLWDAASGAVLRVWDGPSDGIADVAFSADGQLISVARDGTEVVRTIAGDDGRAIPLPIGGNPVMALSTDGRRVVVADDDNVVREFSVGASAATPLGDRQDSRIGAIAIAPDGRSALTGDDGGLLRLWDIVRHSPIRAWKGGGAVRAVAFAPDGGTIVSSDGVSLKTWDRQSGALLRTVSDADTTRSLAVSPDGRRILEGSSDSMLRLRDARTGDLLATLTMFAGGDWAVLTPAGFFAASPGGRKKLVVVEGMTARPLDAAYPALERPDRVRAALAGDGAASETAAKNIVHVALRP